MKVLREQQEIQQKAARILHDTEKMKEEVQNKLESLKRKVENDLKNIGEFLKEANVQFATYEYIFQEDDCKRIQINEQNIRHAFMLWSINTKYILVRVKQKTKAVFIFHIKPGYAPGIVVRILSRPIVPCTFVRIGSPFTHSSKII